MEGHIPTVPNLDSLVNSYRTGQMPSMEQAFDFRLEQMQGEFDIA